MPTISTPLATFEDVELAYEGTFAAANEPRVQVLLDTAIARLQRLRPSVAADVVAGAVPAVLVRAALVNAVLRVLRAPGAFRSETAGEYSYTLNTAVASGALDFTDAELADCSPAPSSASGAAAAGVGSVTLVLSGWRMP